MKPFDLELAKAGHPVQTKDGSQVRILCFDRKNGTYPIVSLLENDGYEVILKYTIDGKFYEGGEDSNLDLVMAPEKHEGWINIYRREEGTINVGGYHKTKEDAEAKIKFCGFEHIATVKIEWEE